MSHSRDYEDAGPTTAYYQGVQAGAEAHQERIYKAIYKYFRGYDKFPNPPHKIDEVKIMTIMRNVEQDYQEGGEK